MCRYVAELERKACRLICPLSAMGCDAVLLVWQGFSGLDLAVLEHHSGVTEDEIDCATDFAVSEKLAHGVRVE